MPMLRDGHWKSLALLEETAAIRTVLALYRDELAHPVYLRPTDKGLTVISLDPATQAMVGVGGADCSLRMPASSDSIRAAAALYRTKVAAMKRGSIEERFVLSKTRSALGDALRLRKDLLFLHQELRFANANKIDVLAVDPTSGQLVVIEAKESEAAVRRDGAAAQAEGYCEQLTEHADELFPFLSRLLIALARLYDAPEPVALNRGLRPRWEIWWPRGTQLGPRHA